MSGRRTAEQRAAYTRWQAKRRRLIAYGQWNPFVDAEPVRAHLLRLRDIGMPTNAVERNLGLNERSFDHLMWGSSGTTPGRLIRSETAELVLSYWPVLDDFPEKARIDATGTHRRVRALMAVGYGLPVLADRLGMERKSLQRVLAMDRVRAGLARSVRDMYDDWWRVAPEDNGVRDWIADRARRYAARAGYVGPLAWDDDTIDDPQAVPQTDVDAPVVTAGGSLAARWLMGESVILDRTARNEVIAHLYEWTNSTTEEIATRLEMKPETVERVWSRIKQKARETGGPVPWRRAYVPRERVMARAEVREAA